MLLVIDNYDSFTYNLVQALGQLGEQVRVFRNDELALERMEELAPDAILLSPGPSRPERAGITLELIRKYQGRFPMLGVCLGHQAIGHVFGARVIRAQRVMHGKTSQILHDGRTIFRGIPNPFQAGRYHSLILERESLPSCLELSAQTSDGEVMGIRHKEMPLEGVQFHPESILTPSGKRLLRNFLQLVKEGNRA
ncbi:MAG: aminodeoxychorismate/anthranilate synthase component II [bacterium]